MPIDLTIPTIVDFYLSIIDRLSTLSSEHDSNSNATKAFVTEINYYLELIRNEMSEAAKQHKEDINE